MLQTNPDQNEQVQSVTLAAVNLEPETNSTTKMTREQKHIQEFDSLVDAELAASGTSQLSNKVQPKHSGLRKRTALKVALAASITSFLLSFPACVLVSQLARAYWPAFVIGGAILTLAGMVGIPITLFSMYYSNARASANEPMPSETGIAVIGPLLDRMNTDVENVSAIRVALTEPLMQLTPSDTTLLERRHYNQLNMYLQRISSDYSIVRDNERGYVLSVLHAYSCVGDPKAISHVERIAQGKANTRLRDVEVRDAARNCLVHLNEAKAQLSHHKTLLRSADVATLGGELMRPAASDQDNEPGELMRPTATDAASQPRDQ